MKPPVCPECRYNLSGLNDATHQCPECGTHVHIEPVELRVRPFQLPVEIDLSRAGFIAAMLIAVWLLLSRDSETIGLFLLVAFGLIVAFEVLDWSAAKQRSPAARPWPYVLTTDPHEVQIVDKRGQHATVIERFRWKDLGSVRSEWYGHNRAVLRFTLTRDAGVLTDRHKRYEVDCTRTHADALANECGWLITGARIALRHEGAEH